MSDFPKWGFWTEHDTWHGSINVTCKAHLFVNEKQTVCGYKPSATNEAWFRYMRYSFSEKPMLGIYGVAFEMANSRQATMEDFKKCKKCLKRRTEHD